MSATDFGGRVKKTFNQDGVRLRIDNIIFFDGLLYIRGWALENKCPVKSIQIRAAEGSDQTEEAGRELFAVYARTGEPREDVARVFGLSEESLAAGFEAAAEGIDTDQIVISIRVRTESGVVDFNVGSKTQIKMAEPDVSSGVLILTERPLGSAVRRYRADHLAEELTKKGVRARVVNPEYGYEPERLDYKHLVLQRTGLPCYQYIADRFRRRGGKVLFEIDDALFSDEISMFNEFLKSTPQLRQTGADHMTETVRHCDGIIASTEYLAEIARMLFRTKTVYVNRNVANDKLAELSETARTGLTQDTEEGIVEGVLRKVKRAIKDSMNISQLVLDEGEDDDSATEEEAIRIGKNKDAVTIGYFSGSGTHDRDFIVISEILADIMEKHRNVSLLLAGKINVPAALDVWKERIDRVDTVDWKKLPAMIAGVDINLAPLMDTRFNKCKSAIKWLEAALVGVPTVATRNDEFSRVVRDGETGLLCSNEEEWREALERLVTDGELRKQLSEAARKEALEKYTTDTINEELLWILSA